MDPDQEWDQGQNMILDLVPDLVFQWGQMVHFLVTCLDPLMVICQDHQGHHRERTSISTLILDLHLVEEECQKAQVLCEDLTWLLQDPICQGPVCLHPIQVQCVQKVLSHQALEEETLVLEDHLLEVPEDPYQNKDPDLE